jgi:hypothetical protein
MCGKISIVSESAPISAPVKLTRTGFRDFLKVNRNTMFTAQRESCGIASYVQVLSGDPAAWMNASEGTFGIPSTADIYDLPDWAKRFVKAFYAEANGDTYFIKDGAYLLKILHRVTRGKPGGRVKGQPGRKAGGRKARA